jgi:universal stress protein A
MKKTRVKSKTAAAPAAPKARIVRDKPGDGTGPVIELAPSMLRMKKILVPIDFSDASSKALRYAVSLAQQFGAKITLLHVLEPLPYPPDITYLPIGQGLPVKATQEKLDEMAHATVEAYLLDGALVRAGRAFDAITETARKLKADLIVISTHGYTGLRHVLLGSTAERVVRYAPCPVFTVRERERDFV